MSSSYPAKMIEILSRSFSARVCGKECSNFSSLIHKNKVCIVAMTNVCLLYERFDNFVAHYFNTGQNQLFHTFSMFSQDSDANMKNSEKKMSIYWAYSQTLVKTIIFCNLGKIGTFIIQYSCMNVNIRATSNWSCIRASPEHDFGFSISSFDST